MLEPVKTTGINYKSVIKSALKIITPLIITILAVVVLFMVADFRENRRNALTREALLYDFDYLITTLEENFPSFGIIYRRNGVDMMALAQDVRIQLYEMPNLDVVRFWITLRDNFFYYAYPVGHLRIVDGVERRILVDYRIRNSHLAHELRDLPGTSPRLLAAMPTPTGAQLQFDFIDEGRIAYLAINGSMTWTLRDELRVNLRNFYQDIAGYEHLIIDMRHSPGGHPRFFTDYIAPPLVRDRFIKTFYNFYQAGSHNVEFMYRRMVLQGLPFCVSDLDELFPGEYIPQYLIDDLSNKDFMFRSGASLMRGITPSPFNGEIWMLIGPHMYSGSQTIATLVYESGFATMVGETTGGMAVATRPSSNFFALPNTGIVIRYDHALITDSRGRPLEYGTDPHYFNRPGMDALETVLALIEEGWSR